MTVLSEPSRRQELGRALRELRRAAGLSGTQLAERLGLGQATVSRMENGRQLPSPEHLDRWATATGARPEQREQLGDLAEMVTTEAIPWRYRPARLVAMQDETADLEQSAGLNRGYHPLLVHSLLQVPGYARAAYQGRARLEGRSESEVIAAVARRMAKQGVLYEPGHRFEFLMTEAGLRWRFVPREVMAAQLDRLAQAAMMPNVLLGIIPMAIEVPVWGWQGFAAFLERADDAEDLVLVETLTAALTIRNPADVARYGQAFAALLDASMTGDQALALLAQVAADL